MRTRIFTLLVAFLAIAGNAVWGQGTSLTGEGTPENPYQISTPEELKAFRDLVNGGDADACAILKNDIELNSSEEWEPIGYTQKTTQSTPWGSIDAYTYSYTGTFNGGGHTISGIKITTGEDGTAGVFKVIGTLNVTTPTRGGKVENLTVEGSINGNFVNAGGICYYNIGEITNCINNISISGSSTNAGGICCVNYGDIKNCTNLADLSSASGCGGICVGAFSGCIEKCYNAGSITSGSGSAGGICGSGNT